MPAAGPKYGLSAALHTRMSMPPQRAIVPSTKARNWSLCTMSQGITAAAPPRAAIASATSAQAGALRLDTTTFAPCSANRSAMARPMPREAPVTTAIFPVRSNSVSGIRTLGPVLRQFQAADLVAVHFVRPIDDAQRARVAIHRCQGKILADASGAVRLDGPVDHLAGHLRRRHLDHSNFPPRLLVDNRVHLPCRVQHQQPCLIDQDARLRDPPDHHALLGQWLAEGGAGQGALAGQFQRPLG